MIIKNKEYLFKKEFCKELNIPNNQCDRRKEELLEWLTNFYDYKFYPSKPDKIYIKEIYGDYQPLPRKAYNQNELNKQKKDDYSKYTIAALGPDFKPNSKRRIAREAIYNFGYKKYGHNNAKYVANSFIKEPFDKYGISNNVYYWVYFDTYEPLEEEDFALWMKILHEEHISESEAANAFYRASQGEDITKEKNNFIKARERFLHESENGVIPVRVKAWKLNIDKKLDLNN